MSSQDEKPAIAPLKAAIASTRTPVEIREGRSISVVRCATRGISATDRDVMVVFFHGSLASLDQFRGYFNDSMLQSVNVASYDALGCGYASKPNGHGNSLYSEDEMVADAEAFVKLIYGAGTSPGLTRDLRGSVSGSLTSKLRFVLVGHSFGSVVALRVARAAVAAGYDIAGVLLVATGLECPAAAKHPIFGMPDCCLSCLQGSMSADFAHRAYHPLSDPELVEISRYASQRNYWDVIKPFYAGMHWGIHLGATGKVQMRWGKPLGTGTGTGGGKAGSSARRAGAAETDDVDVSLRGEEGGPEEGGPASGSGADAAATEQGGGDGDDDDEAGLGPAARASLHAGGWGIPGVPVLVLHGEEDGILPLDGARALARRFWEEADGGSREGAGGGGKGGRGGSGSSGGSGAGTKASGEARAPIDGEGSGEAASAASADSRVIPYGLGPGKMLQMAREAVAVAERRSLWLGIAKQASHQVMEERPQLVSAFVRALADRPAGAVGVTSAGAHV